MELNGKVAVITGAASGIGFATAGLLARQGMKLVLADVNAALLDEAVGKITADGAEAIGVATDVRSSESMTALADAAYARFGAVHLLHLNAGISPRATFFDDDGAVWQRVVEINLLGVVWGIKAFVNRMVEGGDEGLILATSSGAGAEGTSYNSPSYAATKMAVVSTMEALHGQLRDRKAKIRAGIVFPPLTATHLGGHDPVKFKHIEAYLKSTGIPTTLVQPEQVAAMVLDGIQRDRFFIKMDERVAEQCYGGAIDADFFSWNERIIRGRAEAQLSDGKPDAYLW